MLTFLKDLISWFFRGEIAEKKAPSPAPFVESYHPAFVEPAPVEKPKKEKKAKEPAIDFSENRAEAFLNELKAIEPLSKGFEKAREELLAELRKLAPPRRRPVD